MRTLSLGSYKLMWGWWNADTTGLSPLDVPFLNSHRHTT